MTEQPAKFWRFATSLRRFLSSTLSPAECRRIVEEDSRNRERGFLRLLDRAVYNCPASPYLRLLRWAGVEYGDIARLVAQDGVDAALGRLFEAGVHVGLDEFKGRRPIERPGLRIDVRPGDMDNPLLAREFETESSGSTGPRRRAAVDLELLVHDAAAKYLGLQANGIECCPMAVWRPVPPGSSGWRWSSFAPPRNANHEANAPNRWHLAILLLVSCVLILRALRRRERERPLYALALLCAFIAFCAYLKWQPFLARLLLPLFVLGAPLAGAVAEVGGRRFIPVWRWLVLPAFCLFLLSIARLPLLQNWVRPLQGPNSVFHTPRSVQYFADMSQWDNQASYWKAVDLLGSSDCRTVGIDITNLHLEYPLQALLRERKPETRFIHTGVENASARYPQPIDAIPCAVACLDCAGDVKRLRLYGDFPISVRIDKFVIFLR